MRLRSSAFVIVLFLAGICVRPAHPTPPGSAKGKASSPKAAPSATPVSSNKPLPPNKLDTAHIHQTYVDGDFDLATELIEDALKYGGPFSRQDSIFIYKHLGVMYAAKYETREKGKHYLLKLLHVDPTAKILDMYASDMIYMIFKNIKDEFESTDPRFAKDPGKPPRKDTQPTPGGHPRSHGWLGWAAGALAAAGGIALAVHLLEDEPSPSVTVETVP